MDFSQIQNDLVSEIKLTPLQAQIFLLITIEGQMTFQKIADKLNLSQDEVMKNSRELINFGAFIDITKTEVEAMHPRFTAVNMYRKMCERENLEFKRNKIVDNIGVVLERPYDAARTK